MIDYTRPNGSQGRKVTPYVVDLNSANGTFVNNQRIEAQKYVELLEKDVLKFGFSSREYVMLHDQSKEDGDDPGIE
jgi:smad nuclear-interacting protein 1